MICGPLVPATQDACQDAGVVAAAVRRDESSMPGVRLSGGEASLAVDLRQLLQLRDGDFAQLRAGARQDIQRPLEARGDIGGNRVEHVRAQHSQAQISEGHARQLGIRLACEHGIQRRATGDGIGERSDGVQTRGQRISTADRHSGGRGLEAHDSAQRRGNPARAAGVGAQRAE